MTDFERRVARLASEICATHECCDECQLTAYACGLAAKLEEGGGEDA